MKTNKKIKNRDILLVAITLLIGISIGWLFFYNSNDSNSVVSGHNEASHDETTWTCSMHPQIKQDEPGQCPICGMDLVPLASLASDDEAAPDEIQLSESAIQLANIQTTVVSKGMPEKSISLLGKVKPDERNIAELTARYGGRIEKLYVNYTGQYVSKGQKLTTLYSPELINAQKELLEAAVYKEKNPTYYKAAVSKLKLWDLNDEQIENIIQKSEPQLYFDVLSPISGTVSQRYVALGDYVKEGDALFKVIDLSNVWVMFDAYESDLPWIKKGDKVKFQIQSIPGKQFEGRVTYIDPFINAETRVAQVRVEVPNSKNQLKPEMFASGVLQSKIAQNSNEILIPKSAILWTGKRAVVYVKSPRLSTPTFAYREITLGPEAGNFYVVADGLSAGEEIATNGVFKIDAAAQLAGKPSMMSPEGGASSSAHDHSKMNMNGNQSSSNMEDMDEETHKRSTKTVKTEKANIAHESFKVYGNCSMCKARIEKAALSLDGVNSADWSAETKIIHLSLNKDKVKVSDIHKAIAKVGHDTEKETAPADVYKELPECCQYTRE